MLIVEVKVLLHRRTKEQTFSVNECNRMLKYNISQLCVHLFTLCEDYLFLENDELYRVGQTQLGSFLSLITNQSNNTRENGKVPFVYRQQNVLFHFPVCCWIDSLLMITKLPN
jgi:hypothetical protein